MATEFKPSPCGCMIPVNTDPAQIFVGQGGGFAPFISGGGNYFLTQQSQPLPQGVPFTDLPTAPQATGGGLVTGVNEAGQNVNWTIREISEYASGLINSYAFDVTADPISGAINQTYLYAGQPDGAGGFLPNLIGGGLLFAAVEGQPLTLSPTANKPIPDVVLDASTGLITFNTQLITGQTINLIYKTA